MRTEDDFVVVVTCLQLKGSLIDANARTNNRVEKEVARDLKDRPRVAYSRQPKTGKHCAHVHASWPRLSTYNPVASSSIGQTVFNDSNTAGSLSCHGRQATMTIIDSDLSSAEIGQ